MKQRISRIFNQPENKRLYKIAKAASDAAALAGIASGCGFGIEIRTSPSGKPRKAQNPSPVAQYPTPFGRRLLKQGYKPIEPDFENSDLCRFYFTNGEELVVVGSSPAMPSHNGARGISDFTAKDGIVSAVGYGVRNPKPISELNIKIERRGCEKKGSDVVKSYSMARVPLSQLSQKGAAEVNEKLEETKEREQEALEAAAAKGSTSAGVSVPGSTPAEQSHYKTWGLCIGLPLVVAAGGYLIYNRMKLKSRQPQ